MQLQYHWKVDKYGIERVSIDEGVIDADSLDEAKSKADAQANAQDWGEWQMDTIQLDNGDPLRLSDLTPPIPCFIKKTNQFGKPHELTVWAETSIHCTHLAGIHDEPEPDTDS